MRNEACGGLSMLHRISFFRGHWIHVAKLSRSTAMSGMGLGRTKNTRGQAEFEEPSLVTQTLMAAISGLMPMIFISRVRL